MANGHGGKRPNTGRKKGGKNSLPNMLMQKFPAHIRNEVFEESNELKKLEDLQVDIEIDIETLRNRMLSRAEKLIDKCMDALEAALECDNMSVREKAANSLLDRVFGRARQAIEAHIDSNIHIGEIKLTAPDFLPVEQTSLSSE